MLSGHRIAAIIVLLMGLGLPGNAPPAVRFACYVVAVVLWFISPSATKG
jgi:hypothetical protein